MPTEPLDMHRNTLHPEDVARVLAGTVSVGQLQGRFKDIAAVVAALMAKQGRFVNASYAPGFAFDKEEALWAVSMVTSRSFVVRATPSIPLSRMMNRGLLRKYVGRCALLGIPT